MPGSVSNLPELVFVFIWLGESGYVSNITETECTIPKQKHIFRRQKFGRVWGWVLKILQHREGGGGGWKGEKVWFWCFARWLRLAKIWKYATNGS